MNVLLVHPEDNLPSGSDWDLVVDFGRAPVSTYEEWSEQTRSVVKSVYDFAEQANDLSLCRKLLNRGTGVVVDEHGIDWWDVLSLRLVPDLQQLILLDHLWKSFDDPVQLYATRPFPFAKFLQQRLSGNLRILNEPWRLRHYWRSFRRLDHVQFGQIVQDKFDRNHTIRRKLARIQSASNQHNILLPSAYGNASRMAVRYAELLPQQNFLLASARRSGRLQSVPENVTNISLDPYFTAGHARDTSLMRDWNLLRKHLVQAEPIFKAAEDCGILKRVESDLEWVLRIRDAWINLFDHQNVIGCFCADDTNPYTSTALLLAKARGLPGVVCHHGALDCWMAFKNPAADCYLAKSKMERDYLISRCGLSREKVVLGGPNELVAGAATESEGKESVVWFTEAYEAFGWRSEAVYKDLLPRLYSLAQSCGLKLVLKLHPFDSVRDHRRKLRSILKNDAGDVEVIDGPTKFDLWRKLRFAFTSESSVALECAARRIPIFLCTWLSDCYSGYSDQYAKFAVGIPLQSSQQIADIPLLLANHRMSDSQIEQTLEPDALRSLFNGCMMGESALYDQKFATRTT